MSKRSCAYAVFGAVVVMVAYTVAAMLKYYNPTSTVRRSVSGVVVDASTQETVSEAKVVVTWFTEYFPDNSDVIKAGQRTSNNGEFDVSAITLSRVDSVLVEAISPSGKYGTSVISDSLKENVVRVEVHNQEKDSARKVHYGTFEGAGWAPVEWLPSVD